MTLRTWFFVVAVAACGHKDKAPTQGSGSAPPPPAADAAVAPIVVDAAPPPATFDQTIRADGVGPIKSDTDPAKLGELFPGTVVDADHFEGEAKQVDTNKISNNGTQLLETKGDNSATPKIGMVTVISSAFATKEGIRVGTTVQDFVTKFTNGDCRRETLHTGDAENPPEFTHVFECTTPDLPNVTFNLDETKPANQGADGKVIAAKIAQEKFVRIIWVNPAGAKH